MCITSIVIRKATEYLCSCSTKRTQLFCDVFKRVPQKKNIRICTNKKSMNIPVQC